MPHATFAEDDSWLYAVQLHAVTETNPAAITLLWKPDLYGATNFTIYRKGKEENSWGEAIASLPGTATNFTDHDVSVGTAYEYRVDKHATLGYRGYGYIYAGMNVPLIENRGTILLVVESSADANLRPELDRLRQDLVGDGWQVQSFTVSSQDSPEHVRALISGAHQADTNLNAVFLFGHVPVAHSGNLDWDTHGARPMPADAYYGYLGNDWPLQDPTNSPGYLPGNVELMVGRVDFADMNGDGSIVPWPTETQMLRNYLEKDHRWRHKLVSVPRRALMGNGRGDEYGQAAASTGYRNFEPFVGPGNVIEADVSYEPPFETRWISRLGAESYLWAYGCGGGAPDGCGALGTNVAAGVPGFLYSRDVVAVDAKAVFVLMFGSWFGEWDLPDNLLRSFLVTSTGLVSCMAGRPHWFIHHMSLGETIGYGARLSANNSGLYLTQSNAFTRAIYTALLGDPALRMEQVAPPANIMALGSNGVVNLSWSNSPDAIVGYYVYRAAGVDGPFARITPSPVTNAFFQDYSVSSGNYAYMVRAVALQENPSGSYYNASQGIVASTSVQGGPPAAVYLRADATEQGFRLSWNSQPGGVYHIFAHGSQENSSWIDASGPITALSTNTSWLDSTLAQDCRYYRVEQAQ